MCKYFGNIWSWSWSQNMKLRQFAGNGIWTEKGEVCKNLRGGGANSMKSKKKKTNKNQKTNKWIKTLMETEFEPREGEVRKIEEKRNRKWIWGRKTSEQGWWAWISYFDTPSRIVKCDYFRRSKTKFYPPYRGYIWSWKDKLVSDNAQQNFTLVVTMEKTDAGISLLGANSKLSIQIFISTPPIPTFSR